MFLLEFWVLLKNHPQLRRKACYTLLFNTRIVLSIECNTVCELRMVMSQNVTFLSLYSLIQIYYFKNGPNVTVTLQIISSYTEFPSLILLYSQIIQENVIFDIYQMSTLCPTFFIMSIWNPRGTEEIESEISRG